MAILDVLHNKLITVLDYIHSGVSTSGIESKLDNIETILDDVHNITDHKLNVDAFGRLRISEPYTLFDNSLTTPMGDNLYWSTLTSGTATGSYTRLQSMYEMKTSGIGSYIIRQTIQRFKYQPGKSHQILLTGLLNTESGYRKRVGYVDFDNIGLVSPTNIPQNGVFFENNSGVISWNIVNNGIITENATQSQWNYDKCDGNGNSLFTLDINSTNIFFIDMEWLGVGSIRCGFVSKSGGVVVAHQFQHASNSYTDVYMRTANLPVAYSLESTADTTTGTMKQICAAVMSEGGYNPAVNYRAIFNNTVTQISANATESLIGIRLKSDYFEQTVEIDSISILAVSTANTRWILCYNPTFSGTPTWIDVDNSSVQYSQSNLSLTSVGTIIASGVFSLKTDATSSSIPSGLKIGKKLSGELSEIWIVITALSNSTENYWGTLNLRESI